MTDKELIELATAADNARLKLWAEEGAIRKLMVAVRDVGDLAEHVENQRRELNRLNEAQARANQIEKELKELWSALCELTHSDVPTLQGLHTILGAHAATVRGLGVIV